MKVWLIAAMTATAFAVGACQSDPVVDGAGRKVENFDRGIFCLITLGWDTSILDEEAGLPPTRGDRPETWAHWWLQRLDATSHGEGATIYVDYLVEHRRDAGLPDLPDHTSAGVYAPYDCNDHFISRESVPIPGGMAEWTQQPTATQIRAVFPAAAVAAQRDGLVQLTCGIQPNGRLIDCQVTKETPAGMGFGAAALKLAPDYKVKAWGPRHTPDLPATIQRGVWFSMHECLPPREARYGRPCGSG